MNKLRNLWEEIQQYRRSREQPKLWERVADWSTAFQILFLVAMFIYVAVASLWDR